MIVLLLRWWCRWQQRPLLIRPGVHDRLIQGRRLLQSDVSPQGVHESCDKNLYLMILSDARVMTREGHEPGTIVIHRSFTL
jgi:hypothetical protein